MGYHVCEKSQRDTDYHLNRNATSLLIRNISALAFGGSSRGPARPSRGRVAWSPGRRLLSEPLDGRPVGPGQLGLGPTCESRLWGCGARPRLPGPGGARRPRPVSAVHGLGWSVRHDLRPGRGFGNALRSGWRPRCLPERLHFPHGQVITLRAAPPREPQVSACGARLCPWVLGGGWVPPGTPG